MRRVKQITVAREYLYALCEDGTIWKREADPDQGTATWYEVELPPAPPQESIKSYGTRSDLDPHYGGPRQG